MKFPYTLYVLCSVSIFCSVLLRTYLQHYRFIDVWRSINEDTISCILFLNFLCAMGIAFFKIMIYIFISDVPDSIFKRANKKFEKLLKNVVIVFSTMRILFEPQEILSVTFYLMIRVFGFIVLGKVTHLDVYRNFKSVKLHSRLLISELLTFMINIYHSMFLLIPKSLSVFSSILALYYLHGLTDSIYSFIRHIMYFNSFSTQNNYSKCHIHKKYIKLTMSIIKMPMILIFGSIFLGKSMRSFSLLLAIALESIQDVANKILCILNWRKAEDVLQNNLFPCTPNDIDREDICIICRCKMNIEDSRKLACGHCYHLECMEHWIHNHSACPLCNAKIINNENINNINNHVQNHQEDNFNFEELQERPDNVEPPIQIQPNNEQQNNNQNLNNNEEDQNNNLRNQIDEEIRKTLMELLRIQHRIVRRGEQGNQ